MANHFLEILIFLVSHTWTWPVLSLLWNATLSINWFRYSLNENEHELNHGVWIFFNQWKSWNLSLWTMISHGQHGVMECLTIYQYASRKRMTVWVYAWMFQIENGVTKSESIEQRNERDLKPESRPSQDISISVYLFTVFTGCTPRFWGLSQ